MVVKSLPVVELLVEEAVVGKGNSVVLCPCVELAILTVVVVNADDVVSVVVANAVVVGGNAVVVSNSRVVVISVVEVVVSFVVATS